jgi:uncharacterized membrane-anchored protein
MLSGNSTIDRYTRIGDITGVLQAMEDGMVAMDAGEYQRLSRLLAEELRKVGHVEAVSYIALLLDPVAEVVANLVFEVERQFPDLLNGERTREAALRADAVLYVAAHGVES